MSDSGEKPPLSVVICTKDRPEAVRETIADLRSQAGASPFEILVIDDGSEPALTLGLFAGQPEVRVSRICHQGRSAARNHGAELARGSLVVFLDDDGSLSPGFLAAHERAHWRWGGALAVGPQVLCDSSLATPFGRFRRRLETRAMPKAEGIVNSPNFCTAANMSIPRQLFVDLGGFDPRLHCAEDQDLALRHSRGGGHIIFVPEAVATHHDSALDIRSYTRKAEWTAQHLVAFCRAQPDWPENHERLRINGPPLPGREPAVLTAKKLGKSLLSQPLILQMLFGLTTLIERTLGDGPLLDRFYETLQGIHLQRGFRRGWVTTRGVGGNTEEPQ